MPVKFRLIILLAAVLSSNSNELFIYLYTISISISLIYEIIVSIYVKVLRAGDLENTEEERERLNWIIATIRPKWFIFNRVENVVESIVLMETGHYVLLVMVVIGAVSDTYSQTFFIEHKDILK